MRIVEDTSGIRPVTFTTTSLKETITFFEQEVVFFELLLLFRSKFTKRVVGTLQLSFKAVKSLDSESFNFLSLFLRNVGTKRNLSKISSNSNTSRDNIVTSVLIVEVFEVVLANIPRRDVLSISIVIVIVFNDLV